MDMTPFQVRYSSVHEVGFYHRLKVELLQLFSCLRLRQWPVTYLMTLSDWTKSCQPGPPRARYGQ